MADTTTLQGIAVLASKATYQEPDHTIYCGHALDILKEMPAETVDMVMTSPPYWGLRTYKTEPIIWGENHCEHEWGDLLPRAGYRSNDSNPGTLQSMATQNRNTKDSCFCLKCNAWRGELGLEPTIEPYIEHLILIFNEVNRVLKKTGTCWVNLDDSYATHASGGKDYAHNFHSPDVAICEGIDQPKPPAASIGLPEKSLCLIPQRFAIAMVENGWILRNDIVWNKPNPMPESVKDRFTGSWEHLFLFVKSKRYFFEQQFDAMANDNCFVRPSKKGINPKYEDSNLGSNHIAIWAPSCPQRNKRDVWEINTEPYPEAHFATFPEKLCETPILAGCPEDGIVLDPFTGSGTAQAVAKRLGRKSIGIELNPNYCKLAAKRLQEIPMAMPLFVADSTV